MKPNLIRLLIVSLICCMAALPAQAQQAETPLTNAAIIKLVRAGFKEKTVVALIHNRPNRFNLNPDKLIELKRSGVSENIIIAMLALNDSFVVTDDEWIDNSGFRGSGGAGDGNLKGQPGGSEIFGTSPGSRSQNNGRRLDGDENSANTTPGKATRGMLILAP